MSKNSGNNKDARSQTQEKVTKPPIQQQYDDGDTDTDDENNSSVLNDRQGGAQGAGINNA